MVQLVWYSSCPWRSLKNIDSTAQMANKPTNQPTCMRFCNHRWEHVVVRWQGERKPHVERPMILHFNYVLRLIILIFSYIEEKSPKPGVWFGKISSEQHCLKPASWPRPTCLLQTGLTWCTTMTGEAGALSCCGSCTSSCGGDGNWSSSRAWENTSKQLLTHSLLGLYYQWVI